MFFRDRLLVVRNIAEQINAIHSRWPGFKVTRIGDSLKAVGDLKPTARSGSYKVQIIYNLGKPPVVTLLEPHIVPNFNGEMPEHLYKGGKLCLYRPIYGEFRYCDLLSETIVPWTSLWLYHYEVWHMIGEWLGGGEHPP